MKKKILVVRKNAWMTDRLRRTSPNDTSSIIDVFDDDDILLTDLSQGEAPHPIPVFNAIDKELPVTDFHYIDACEYIPPLQLSARERRGCSCENGQCNGQHCDCVARSTFKVIDGLILGSQHSALREEFTKNAFFECAPGVCACEGNCRQRLTEDEFLPRLQLFKTPHKGFACRVAPTSFIMKGSFVCEFIGEVLNEKEASKRDDRQLGTYSFLLSEGNDSERNFTVDPTTRGNVARFFSHACEPNLFNFRFYKRHRRLSRPSLGFYAARNIFPLEELTISYGDNYWENSTFPCACGSEYCRFSTKENTLSKEDDDESDDESVLLKPNVNFSEALDAKVEVP